MLLIELMFQRVSYVTVGIHINVFRFLLRHEIGTNSFVALANDLSKAKDETSFVILLGAAVHKRAASADH